MWLIIHSSLHKCLILFLYNISTLIGLLPRNKKLGLAHASVYQISIVCAYRSGKDYLILLNLLLEFHIPWSLWVIRFSCFWRVKWETVCLIFKFTSSVSKIRSCTFKVVFQGSILSLLYTSAQTGSTAQSSKGSGLSPLPCRQQVN